MDIMSQVVLSRGSIQGGWGVNLPGVLVQAGSNGEKWRKKRREEEDDQEKR